MFTAYLRAIAQRANTYNTQTVDHKPLKLCSVQLALAQMGTLKSKKKASVSYFPGFIGEIKSILKTKMAGYAYTFYSRLYTLAITILYEIKNKPGWARPHVTTASDINFEMKGNYRE